jgi:hypothetical protein
MRGAQTVEIARRCPAFEQDLFIAATGASGDLVVGGNLRVGCSGAQEITNAF